MSPEDLLTAARIAKKYAVAVENKLYWDMSPLEAQTEIAEAVRIASLLEAEVSVVEEDQERK
jgi:hypothetical protein